MYAVGVRDHVMIAHSFHGELFGPAQKLHGATYVVDVELRRAELSPDGVVVDIGRATSVLREVLGELNYKNLDELDAFRGQNTTTEYLAGYVFRRMARAARGGGLGPGSEGLSSMRVTLWESHVAWASFEGEIPREP